MNDRYMFIFFFPFLLDMYDFMWGEAFLYKVEQFSHRLVKWSTIAYLTRK